MEILETATTIRRVRGNEFSSEYALRAYWYRGRSDGGWLCDVELNGSTLAESVDADGLLEAILCGAISRPRRTLLRAYWALVPTTGIRSEVRDA